MTLLSVLLLDTEPRTHNHYIVLAVQQALKAHPSVGRVAIGSHRDALQRFEDEGFDTFLAFGSARTHAAVLTRLARRARLSILWTTEDPYEVANNVRYSAAFDIVFTNDKSSVEAYAGRAYHLPLAASPAFQDFAVPPVDDHYLYDLLFIGTAWPNRVKSLNSILSQIKRPLAVKVALPWNQFIGPPQLGDKELAYDWRCGNHDFARFANKSRIVLTLPRHFSASADSKASGSTPPPRLFEAALAGACQVVVSPEPEIEDYYDKTSEIVLCADDAAAVTAITGLIDDPQRRMSIAAAARARTERQHLYRHRIDDLLEKALPHRKTALPPARLRRKTILCVVHNRMGFRPGGGVEIYQELLTRLEPDFEILFLFPDGKETPHGLRLQGRRIDRLFDIGAVERTALSDRPAERVFERILVEHKIDLVHVHHLMHFPLSLPIIAKAYGLPIVWNIHDYYVICDRYNLLNFEGRFCDVVHRGTQHCDNCLLTSEGRPAGSKARRDGLMAEVVSSVDMFLASTAFSADYLRGYYPEVGPEKIKQLELPIPNGASPSGPTDLADKDAEPEVLDPLARDTTLVVAVPGNFTHPKGADYIVELMRLCEGYKIRFEIFGRIEPHIRARLHLVPESSYNIMNGYDQSQIVTLMRSCQVSLHLSVWPETFMLSLSEAWTAGLVPIVVDLGAAADRVTDGVDGFKVPARDATTAFKILQKLYFDRNLLRRLQNVVKQKTLIDTDTHVRSIGQLYTDLIARYPCPHETIPALRPTNFDLGLFEAGIRLNSSSWADKDNLWDAQPGGTRFLPDGGLIPEADLPPEYRSLPLETVLLSDPHIEFYVDTYELDRSPALLQSRDSVALQQLKLAGYVLDDRRLDPAALFLRLRGPKGMFYARMATVQNNDLALRYAYPPAANAGFNGTVDLGHLPAGRYGLDLLQLASRRFLLLENAAELIIQPHSELGHDQAAIWQDDITDVLGHDGSATDLTTANDPAPAGTRILDQNLPRLAGTILGKRQGTWWINGILPASQLPSKALVAAVLDAGSTDMSRWAWGYRSNGSIDALNQASEFRIVSQLQSLDPGEYRLKIARLDEDALTVTATGERLFIPPQDGHYVWVDEVPAAFRPRRIKAVSETLHLDTAVVLDAMAGSRGEPIVQCMGWSYVKGLGAPLASFVTWTWHEETRHCVSAELRREDVAEYFSTEQAMVTGFSFGVPLGAWRQGTLRMFQCYRTRTVEFTGFRQLFGHLVAPADSA